MSNCSRGSLSFSLMASAIFKAISFVPPVGEKYTQHTLFMVCAPLRFFYSISHIMKKETVIDYTSWDLNTKCVKVKNRQKLEAKLKRKARRKNKENLRKILDNIDSI